MSVPWSIPVPNSEKELYTTYVVSRVLTNMLLWGSFNVALLFDTSKTLLSFSFELPSQSVRWVLQLGGGERGISAIHSPLAQLTEHN